MPTTPDSPGPSPVTLGLPGLIREDLQHHWREVSRPGFQALLAYRLGHWAQQRQPTALAQVARVLSRCMTKVVRYRCGIELDAAANLGRRLSVGHQGGIYIGPDVSLGDDCAILQGVRLGGVDAGTQGPGPSIGSRVSLGARAIVDGPVRVGDDARIGPNAVIIEDVPDGATALARPSRVRRASGTNDGGTEPGSLGG